MGNGGGIVGAKRRCSHTASSSRLHFALSNKKVARNGLTKDLHLNGKR